MVVVPFLFLVLAFLVVVVLLFLVVAVLLFLVVAVLLFLVVAVLRVLFSVVAVEILHEGDTVNPGVVFDLYAEEHLFAVESEAAAAVGHLGPGVVDDALFGGRVVAGAQSPAPSPEQPVAGPELEAGVDPAQGVGGARGAGDEAAHPLMRVIVDLVMPADGVDRATHGASAVEQRRRTLDHFQPLYLRRVDQFAVIAGLGGKGAGSDPVLHDQDAVTVETADDGPGRAGTKTAFGDSAAHDVVQQLADGGIRRLGQLVWPERLDTLE